MPTTADHKRAEIKAYLRALIGNPVNGNQWKTGLQNRIEANRFDALQDDANNLALPAGRIFTISESQEDLDWTEARLTETIAIELIAEGETADAQLDTISGQIMRLIRNDRYLGGLVERIKYTKGEIGYEEKVKRDNVSWTMTFEAQYLLPTVPDDTDLQPFVLAHVDYQNPPMSDDIELDQ